MGARQVSSPSSRLQKGKEESSPGPFQGAGLGDKPQVAQDRQEPGGTPRFPTPTPRFEMETGSSSRSALPGHGVGGGGQAGRQTKCHQPGHGGCQPTMSTPPAPVQSPYAWSFEGGERWGPSGNRGVQQTKPGLPKPWADPQDPTKMALPGTARVTGFGKNKPARPGEAKSRGPGGSATLGRQLPRPTPKRRVAGLRMPSAHRGPVSAQEGPRPSCPPGLGGQHRFYPQDGERVTSGCSENRPCVPGRRWRDGAKPFTSRLPL